MAPLARGEVAAFRVTERPAPVPALAFKAPDGRDLTLADFRGKVVLLNLWATWCAPCRHEMPALDRLQELLGGPGFEVVAVNIDTRNPERARTWLAETGIRHMAHYTDHSATIFQDLRKVGRAFGMPTTLVVDAKGCELGYLAGPPNGQARMRWRWFARRSRARRPDGRSVQRNSSEDSLRRPAMVASSIGPQASKNWTSCLRAPSSFQLRSRRKISSR